MAATSRTPLTDTRAGEHAEGASAPPKVIAGVDRAIDPSLPSRVVFTLFHATSTAIAVWILLGGGFKQLGRWFADTESWEVRSPGRAWMLAAATVLALLRHMLTLFYLLKRRVLWSEAIPLGIFMLLMEPGFAILGCGITWPADKASVDLNAGDFVGLFLVLLGSWLTSYAELDRHWWKQRPENKGHCYTRGLWRYSMHMNYFGDCVQFSGWTMLTATWWMAWVPISMALSFAFYHIPGLDSYLEERYGDEFKEWAAKTKKLIPFVW